MKSILFLLGLATHFNAFAQGPTSLDHHPILLNTVSGNHITLALNYPGLANHQEECVFLRAPETSGFAVKKLAAALEASEGWDQPFKLKPFLVSNQAIVIPFNNFTYVTLVKLNTKKPELSIADVIQSTTGGEKIYVSRELCPHATRSEI